MKLASLKNEVHIASGAIIAQLLMKRPSLAGLSPKPPGLRTASADDAEALSRLLGAAFPNQEWSADRARRDLLAEPSVAEVLVIHGDDGPIATASARVFDRFPGMGYVHWVGVHPAARGKRLGEAIVMAVLSSFGRSGFSQAVLETDDVRLPAISSYLSIGFVPQYPEPDHEGRWSQVFAAMAEHRRSHRRENE